MTTPLDPKKKLRVWAPDGSRFEDHSHTNARDLVEKGGWRHDEDGKPARPTSFETTPKGDKISVWAPDGHEEKHTAVNARDLINTGWKATPPEEAPKPVKSAVAAPAPIPAAPPVAPAPVSEAPKDETPAALKEPDFDGMSIEELRAYAAENGVKADPRASAVKLRETLKASAK